MIDDREPLYEDEQIKIGYFDNESWDYLLEIKSTSHPNNYCGFLPKRVLKKIAETPRGKLENKLEAVSPKIKDYLKSDLSIDSLHIALCQAYQEEQNRYINSLNKEISDYGREVFNLECKIELDE